MNSPNKLLTKLPLNLYFFGCKTYAKRLGPIKKLDYRCDEYIFVGYSLAGYPLEVSLWKRAGPLTKLASDY